MRTLCTQLLSSVTIPCIGIFVKYFLEKILTNNDFGILPDFRRPDNIRLGLAPLYTSFTDIYRTVMALRQIVETRQYEAYPLEAPAVT